MTGVQTCALPISATITRDGETIELVSKPAKNGGKSWDVKLDGALHTGDDQAIDKFLSTLQFAQMRREVPKGSVDRKQFGLDTPSVTIDVAMGELAFKLAIGAPRAGAFDLRAFALALAQALWTLGSKLVITTNYDQVLRWACPDSLQKDLYTWTSRPRRSLPRC